MDAGEQATESALVRRARDGDEEAFRKLFDRHADRVRGRIRGRLSPAVQRKVSLADVLQDAYLVAFQRIAEFEDRGDGSFGAWLAQIAENRARKVVERFAGTAKRHVGREVSRGGRPDTHHFQGRGPSPSQLAMAGELREAAARALRKLPEDYREVLRLVQEEDLSFEDAAERMDRSKDAVRMLYGRALDRFAELLEAERGGKR